MLLKRVLKFVVLPVVLVAATLLLAANLLGEPMGTLPPPDPGRPITLPDGRVEPLGDLLARLRERPSDEPEPLGQEAPGPRDDQGGEVQATVDEAEGEVRHVFRWPPPPDEDDVFSLADHALREGRDEEAMALFLSVEENHPRWDDAQRRIGWELLTKRMDRPAVGLAYLNRALSGDPADGENWQDASRVYLRTLGIDWDPVRDPPAIFVGRFPEPR
jgi:hypothetical protein